MSRRIAREVAMKMTFARLLGGDDEYTAILEQMEVDLQQDIRPEDVQFSDELIEGVTQHQAKLDELIAEHAIDWTLDRMPKVDLCILRIALFEMLFRDDISSSISINEAVELAKRFGGDKSPVFINGLLGSAYKQMTAE